MPQALFINQDLVDIVRNSSLWESSSPPSIINNSSSSSDNTGGITNFEVANAEEYFGAVFNKDGVGRTRRSIYSHELMSHGESFLKFDFAPSNYTSRCSNASLSVFKGPVLIGSCGSLITRNFVFASTEYENRVPNPRYCYDKYNKHFKDALDSRDPSTLNQALDVVDLFLPKQEMVITAIERLVPILYPYGSSFPHVIKDVMPRVVLALPYLKAHPDAKILLEKSNTVEIFLKRLGVPLSKVMYLHENTHHARSMYRPAHRTVYEVLEELVAPLCHPGPISTGMYSSEIYHAMKELLVNAPDIPEEQRNLVVYVARDGGHNSEMRRIDNEAYLLDIVNQTLHENAEKFPALGIPIPELVKFDGGSMTLEQSIATFQRARIVFGPHGGGMYNLIFAAPGTHVIELSPDDYGKNEVARFSTVLGMNYHGFIKRNMQRTQTFGKVNVRWILSEILHHFDSRLASEPSIPKKFTRFDPAVLLTRE
eukprot:TRINITY_DN19921_c1_g1_i1.p1 TRINITY_DN19921_c1_g1~~TRINITY_DN19921_c1_g1_i1.p1  ORF type:complete len:559 (-),score=114.72 TRINITY_DN19921_c1_g1_i1:43-1488(-)